MKRDGNPNEVMSICNRNIEQEGRNPVGVVSVPSRGSQGIRAARQPWAVWSNRFAVGIVGKDIGLNKSQFVTALRNPKPCDKLKFVGHVSLLCLVLAAGSSAATAATIVVGGAGAQFQSVQPAIAAAHSGDTVQVQAGTYAGNLTLNKQITLAGISHPTLRGEGLASVITVLADGCVIKGFIIEHSGGDLTREDSGILLKSSNNQIEDNELRDILYGIYLYSSHGNMLRRNRIRGRPELEEGDRGAGLHLWNSPDNVIEDNVISEERDGMYIQSCNGNQIRRNRVSNLRYGLHYMFSDRNVFEDNLFSNNVAGAAIMYSKHIEFRRNAFVHNRGFSSFGILFQECDELVAEDNFIVDNATGIFMEALRKTTFRHNTIANNDVALQMFSSSDRNVFTENNFVDNLSPLQLIGRSTTTRWSVNGRGNFWSDYDGYDLNEDGRGDVPLKIQNAFEYMEGNHPRLRLYLDSPAARAMAVAEKTFPILRGSSEIDDAPLMKAVELPYPFATERPVRHIHVGLMITSLLILGAATMVIWKGQRPNQR
ncbi:MAG TPA: nitrous oxide reductase family maturation protein NosD [Pyrinomonadaceae bacterium]|nr:nitrous oxide reductase family maturation protein NosD [Pyrinomonadaceae bacterium]